MVGASRGYLTSEEREKAYAEGYARGLAEGEVRALYHIMKLSPKEVANKLGKEESEVISIIQELNL